MTTQKAGPADYLGKEIEAARTLLQILKQEEEHLVKADVEAVSMLTGEKSRLAAEMTELASHRHKALQAAGFEASEAGMKAWLDRAAAPAERDAWNALLELAQNGKEQNRVNGLLITQQLACNQNALNVLQGNPQGGDVYGPNGQASNKLGGKRLVIG